MYSMYKTGRGNLDKKTTPRYPPDVHTWKATHKSHYIQQSNRYVSHTPTGPYEDLRLGVNPESYPVVMGGGGAPKIGTPHGESSVVRLLAQHTGESL
jgi:hypothetical protein